MKKLSKILLASALIIAMLVVSTFSVFAAENELALGDNTVAAGTSEEIAVYTFTATESGSYVFTVTGTENYQIGKSGADTYELFEEDTISVRIGEADGDVVINVAKEDASSDETPVLNIGVNEDIAIGDEGTTVMVIATQPGRYSITTDNAIVAVGALDMLGDVNYEENYIDVETKGTPIYFVLAPDDFQATTATVTVNVEEAQTDEMPLLNIGANEGVAIDGEGTTVMVIATQPGRYTITSDDANVIVASVNELGEVNYEENYIDVEVKGTPIYFVLATEDFSNTTASVNVVADTIPSDETPALNIGVNEGVAINGEGTTVTVIATQPGRYTITSDDANVLVASLNELGDVNYEENYVDVEVKGTPIYFVLATEDFSNTTATVTVSVDELPTEEATLLVVGENKAVEIGSEGTIAMVIPSQPGRYTVTTSDEKVIVGVLDMLGNIDFEVNYVDVETKGTPIYFVLATDDFSATTADVTVSQDEYVPVVNTLEVDTPATFTVTSDGIEITVTATKAGVYTIKGEGIKVGVVTVTENGIITDWDTTTLTAAKAGEELVFVVASDDDMTKDVELSVDVTTADVPADSTTDDVQNPDTGVVGLVIPSILALGGVAITAKKKILG